MKNCIIISFLILISIAPVFASPDDLQKGVAVTTENMFELVQTSMPLSVARSGQRVHDDPFVSAFLYNEPLSLVYSLSDNNYLYATEYPDRDLLNRWPLTRWEHETSDTEVAKIYDVSGAQEGGTWHRYAHERLLDTDSLGCLANAPLRYGDADNNGTNELVLYLGKNDQQLDWIMFSPDLEKIIFSARLALQDDVDVRDTKNIPFQFLSEASGPKGDPGRRAYAKLFFGDYDEDGEGDIVVWRKRYESRMKDDPVTGFELVLEVLRHYEFIDGEYFPQKTNAVVIESWLAANELTWSDGYPRLSECRGEEGELIAEMHDPLLNDTDVLPQQ